jgi:hypothetical protein
MGDGWPAWKRASLRLGEKLAPDEPIISGRAIVFGEGDSPVQLRVEFYERRVNWRVLVFFSFSFWCFKSLGSRGLVKCWICPHSSGLPLDPSEVSEFQRRVC